MYRVLAPPASFIQFSGANEVHCIYGELKFCFPFVQNNDVSFMFVVDTDSEGEANALAAGGVLVGIVNDPEVIAGPFLVEFASGMQRYKIGPKQVLYTQTGLPGALAALDIGECFYIRVNVLGNVFTAINCFQRVEADCFTSVIKYGSEEASFGFPCVSGLGQLPNDGDGGQALDCTPTVIEFTNVATLTVPMTQELIDKYSEVPAAEVFIYDENGVLTRMGITVQLVGGVPPSALFFDFSGPSSGRVRIS